jgi:hypothetical protein
MLSALVGAMAVLVVPVLSPGVPGMEQAGPLLGAWLCVSALIEWSRLRRMRPRSIPIAFHGPTGPFRLRVRRRGREVSVERGDRLVAQASTGTRGDRLVVHPDRVADVELEALGTAIGQAMHVIADASARGAAKGRGRPWTHQPSGERGIELVESRARSAFRPAPGAICPASRGTAPPDRPTRAAYRPLVALTRRQLLHREAAQQP